tara:strand:+ start:876 stop:1235 length:360 start_codon:yes stop_codon:yes gene_type:complete
MIMIEYLPILVFLILAFGISVGAIFSSLVVGEKNAYKDKNSTYECGFDPFDDSRSRFEVKFYLVAILFIIFDLEIIFLFPWAIAFDSLGLFGFLSMMFFLLVLTIGFVYEWTKGALDWN